MPMAVTRFITKLQHDPLLKMPDLLGSEVLREGFPKIRGTSTGGYRGYIGVI